MIFARLPRILPIALVLGITIISVSCAGNSSAPAATPTVSAVQRGTISVSIIGTGGLALAHKEDLAFEMAGTVTAVNVDVGESVKAGQELARLDTSEWDKHLKALQRALVTAQRTLTTRTSAVTKAESAVSKAERQVDSKVLAVRQAELDLQTAQYNINQIADIKTAQDKVDDLESQLKLANWNTINSLWKAANPAEWDIYITDLNTQLTQAKKELKDVKDGSSVKLTTDVSLQVQKMNLALEQSRRSLEDAQIAVGDARTAVEDARIAVTNAQLDKADAEQAVKDAQADLDDANSVTPIVKAPFDGFITSINVNSGDDILKGHIAMQIADPNQFEANILVTERDVFSVKVGGDAQVSLDALSGLSFPARITKVAPTGKTTQGVVNFSVTVELTSLKPISSFQQSQGTTSANSQSQTSRPTSTTAAGQTQQPAGQTPAASAPTVTLKDGLSATVTIVVQQKDNILMVPSRAISRQGRDSVVQVVKGTGTEARVVKTGITDSRNTEITDGLSEGEQVQIPASTSATSTSGQAGNPMRIVIPR